MLIVPQRHDPPPRDQKPWLDDSRKCRNHPVDTVVVGEPHLHDIHLFPFDIRAGSGGKVFPNSKRFH